MWTKVNSPASVYCGFHFSNFCGTLTSEQLLKYSYTKFNENMKFGKTIDSGGRCVFQSLTSHIDRLGTMNSSE